MAGNKKIRVCVYLKEANIKWVKEHYGNLSAFCNRILENYFKTLEEIK